jgi:uncharacterized protein YegP (UPF0339 family)
MDRIEVYRDDFGELRWRFVRGGNNKIIASSGEGYTEPRGINEALQIIFANEVTIVRGRVVLIRRPNRTRHLPVVWDDDDRRD